MISLKGSAFEKNVKKNPWKKTFVKILEISKKIQIKVQTITKSK